MNCPNCGTYYDENEKICKKCHTPLSNAVYNQVSSGNDINQPAPKRKSFVPIVAAILICCLIAGGIGGYFYYISRVNKVAGKQPGRFSLTPKIWTSPTWLLPIYRNH